METPVKLKWDCVSHLRSEGLLPLSANGPRGPAEFVGHSPDYRYCNYNYEFAVRGERFAEDGLEATALR